MSPSQQRLTADKLVVAFNNMDIPTILSLRSPDCMRQILPQSLKYGPTDNTSYAKQLSYLLPAFRNFNLTVNEVLEDASARRICMWLSARADTAAGEYVNEYMWTLDFDEGGKKILMQKEFVDTVVNKEFYPKLQAALKRLAAGG
ncbi:hypothetical protein MMC12_005303 [Toensbergia leucococca]|nr:hypothetical protein [Toensbergia leucococca]